MRYEISHIMKRYGVKGWGLMREDRVGEEGTKNGGHRKGRNGESRGPPPSLVLPTYFTFYPNCSVFFDVWRGIRLQKLI